MLTQQHPMLTALAATAAQQQLLLLLFQRVLGACSQCSRQVCRLQGQSWVMAMQLQQRRDCQHQQAHRAGGAAA